MGAMHCPHPLKATIDLTSFRVIETKQSSRILHCLLAASCRGKSVGSPSSSHITLDYPIITTALVIVTNILLILSHHLRSEVFLNLDCGIAPDSKLFDQSAIFMAALYP